MSTIAGTRPYMAPELFADHPKYDKYVDVFSLGVVFMHFLKIKPGEKLDDEKGWFHLHKSWGTAHFL
jgi:serine/threonine protein kinase